MRAHEMLEESSRLAGFERVPADSCVVFDSGAPLTRVMTSINATTGDLLLAKQLGCDGYLLHHPLAGAARRNFHLVFDRMVELMTEHGLTRDDARSVVEDLARRSRFADHLSDWDHLAAAAANVGITLLNVHLPADELGRRVMVEAVRTLGADARVRDVVAALRTIPELAHDANEFIIVPGGDDQPAGRVAVMHAGGTNGGASVATALFERGVGTVVYIHLSGDDAKRLEDRAREGKPGRIVVTGHLASDAIGMNILLEHFQRTRAVSFVRHGGLKPFERRRGRPGPT